MASPNTAMKPRPSERACGFSSSRMVRRLRRCSGKAAGIFAFGCSGRITLAAGLDSIVPALCANQVLHIVKMQQHRALKRTSVRRRRDRDWVGFVLLLTD